MSNAWIFLSLSTTSLTLFSRFYNTSPPLSALLCKAIDENDFPKFQSLLFTNNIDSLIINDGFTVLHYAIGKKNFEIAQHLIHKFPQLALMRSVSVGWTPLHVAATLGDLKTVELLCNAGGTKDPYDNEKNTPLFFACFNGHEKVVEYLIKVYKQQNMLKELINAGNNKNQGCLYVSAFNGYVNICKLLIENGADVNQADFKGNTPLHAAAMRKDREEVASLLIKNGAKVNQRKSDGSTPLFVACFKGNTPVAKLLLENGANPLETDLFKQNPLHIACIYGHSGIIELLLSHESKYKLLSSQDSDAKTPLMVICSNPKIDEPLLQLVAKETVAAKAENLKCESGTALHMAVYYNNLKAVQCFLREAKLSILEKNNQGITPYQVSLVRKYVKIQEYLESLMDPAEISKQQSELKDAPSVQLPKELPEEKSKLDLPAIAEMIKSGKCKNIIVLTGAGISTSAGIPDFRSDTGLFKQLKLSSPEQAFEINTFKQNPHIFYSIAKDFLFIVDKCEPTPTHKFINMLHTKGILVRNYTQNVDLLEEKAGIPKDKIVYCHGTLRSGHCQNPNCNQEFSFNEMKEQLLNTSEIRCTKCNSYVKPDVVFYGEPLSMPSFAKEDFEKCDLLIVMGTSLLVRPFSHFVERVGIHVPRLLINNKIVGQFKHPSNRDAIFLGNCDEGTTKLMQLVKF